GNDDRGAQRLTPAADAGAIAREDRRERLTGFHPIAGPRGDDETDGRIGGVFDACPPAAHLDDAASDRLRLDAGDEAAARRGEDLALRGLRQRRRIVDDAGVSTLRFD